MTSDARAETREEGTGVLDRLARRVGASWVLLDTAAFLNGLALILAANLFFIFPVPALLQRWDEAYAMAFAQRMIAGHDLPYVDAVSQKGPIFYWIVDGTVRLFGADGWLPMRVLGTSCMVLTVTLAFLASCAARRSLAGAIMVFAYFAITMTGGGEGVGGFVMAFCSEHLANVFGMGALLVMTLAWRRKGPASLALVGLGGLLVMLASLTKQVAFTLSVPFGLWALSLTVDRDHPERPRRWSVLVAFAVGLALPFAAVLVRYAAAGELKALLYYAITYNSTIFVPAVTGKHLVQYLNDLFELHAALLFLCAALTGWVLARHALGVRALKSALHVASARAFEFVVGASAVVTVTIALNARRTFAHYYVLPLAWFCLLGGLVVARLVMRGANEARRHPGRTLAAHALALLPVALLANVGWRMHRATLPDEAGFQEAFKTPAWDLCKVVAEKTKPTDSIFVWGFDPMAYTACHRRPATRFLFTIFQAGYVPLLEDPPEVERARVVPGSQEVMLEDLRRDPPAAIFDASETMFGHRLIDQPFIRPLLDQSYCLDETASRMTWIRKGPEGCPKAPAHWPGEKRALRLYVGPRKPSPSHVLESRGMHSDCITLSRPEDFAKAEALGYEQRPATGWDFPGAVLAQREEGTIPLRLYYNPRTGDHFTAASPEARFEAENGGYEEVGVEGYIYPEERPDTIPLKLFYSVSGRDHLTTASAAEEGFARGNGYFLVRIEGYVLRV